MEFLKNLNVNKLFKGKNETGLILHADDQLINQEYFKMHLNDLGLVNRLVMLSNGQEVINYCDQMFEDLYRN